MNSSAPHGVTAVLLGLVLFVVGRFFEDWLSGLFAGAAIALLLLGVLTLSRARRRHGWLPSRDGERR